MERNVLTSLHHPNIIKLFYAFQDQDNLYFVTELAEGGELHDVIRKVGSINEEGSQFIAAEVLSALEYIHSKNIIHRDLKPENILFSADHHIKIIDFGTSKILQPTDGQTVRSGSFCGTAEYVSPEMLKNKEATQASDLWAFGCVIFQLFAGKPPFRASNDYQIFQKILKRDFKFPNGFPKLARDLVEKLLVLDPQKRLGSGGNYAAIKQHPFFEGINFENLQNLEPPTFKPYLPTLEETKNKPEKESQRKSKRRNKSKKENENGNSQDEKSKKPDKDGNSNDEKEENEYDGIDPNRVKLLEEQKKKSKWAKFLLRNELIIESGLVFKKKGLFPRKRHLILTDFPRFLYFDPSKMVKKGEIEWHEKIRAEAKNEKIFYIIIPKRTYHLEDIPCESQRWINAVSKMKDLLTQKSKDATETNEKK
eukprot:Anaeramoba_ignava/a608525_44.p1 GENE.a608525_44~~a608525_44.p1  ORF type:complete len:423 (-),score=155.50 a608525_44:155-1423(-)